MKVYKVLRKNATLHSAIVGRYSLNFKQLVYKPDEVTEAPVKSLGVFCFESLEVAQSFAGHDSCYLIHEAEGLGKPTRRKRIPDFLLPGKRVTAPEGTITFPSIRLGARVTDA